MAMARWAEKTGVVLFILGSVLYVAAKLDFFIRYEPGHSSAYVARHWIFWAGMALIGLLMLIVAGLGKVLGHRRSGPPSVDT